VNPPDEKERNWDREMAEVDKLLAKLPSQESSAPTVKRPAAGAPGPRPRPAGPTAPLVTWLRLGLGLLLGVGMTQWPYSHVCGAKLLLYLVAAGAVITSGVWSAVSSWRSRSALAHVLAILLTFWGLELVTLEVLARVGADALPWFCPEPPSP
jgi:hypothetical protein